MDNCCESIRSKILRRESYATDAHVIDCQGLLQLARGLQAVDIDEHLEMCDHTIRIINELKNVLKDEQRRRQIEIGLHDARNAVKKKVDINNRNALARRSKRFNLH